MSRTLLRNGRLASGKTADILIENSHISIISETGSLEPRDAVVRDLTGALVSPSFVDGHVHLDKTFLGCGFVAHIEGNSVRERIEAERQARRRITTPVYERAKTLIHQMVAFGTTRIRTHVDIDAHLGLGNLEEVLRVRDNMRHLIDIEIVAFPQSGVTSQPGVAELLDEALSSGADLIGGLDPAGIDGNVEGQLDIVFDLAQRHACGIDIHLHDPGPLGCFEMRQIAYRTKQAGLGGRVAVSHAFALGAVEDWEFSRTAEALAAANVAIMTSSPSTVPVPPIERLNAAGVTVFAGSDNIRDAWSPYGNGDMLDRAAIMGARQNFLSNDAIRLTHELVTSIPAAITGMPGHGVMESAVADIAVLDATSIEEAVAGRARRLLVMKAGTIVAENEKLLEF